MAPYKLDDDDDNDDCYYYYMLLSLKSLHPKLDPDPFSRFAQLSHETDGHAVRTDTNGCTNVNVAVVSVREKAGRDGRRTGRPWA